MVKIFENKRVEETDRQHRLTLPSDSNFGALPSASIATLKVRDEENIRKDPMEFAYTKLGDKSYLGGNHWLDFVKSKGIEAGDQISLSKKKKDDYYTIKVIKKN